MLALIGKCIIVWNKIQILFWEMYVTLFERISSLEPRLLFEVLQQSFWEKHAFFKRILQRNMLLVWRCKFQSQSTAYFCLGCSSYRNARLLQVFATCTRWGICNLYKWEMTWIKVKKNIHNEENLRISRQIQIYLQLLLKPQFQQNSQEKIRHEHTRFPGIFNWILYSKDFIP